MPVLGLVRSPTASSTRSPSAVLVTEHGGLGPHLGRLRARRGGRRRASRWPCAPAASWSTRRPPSAPSAASTTRCRRPSRSAAAPGAARPRPTTSTTALLNIKTVSHRHTPPQWFRVPSDDVLQRRRARQPARRSTCERGDRRHRRDDRGPRRRRRGPPQARARATSTSSPTSSRSRTRTRPRRRRAARPHRARPDRRASAAARCSTRPRRCGCSTSTPS